MVHDLKISKGLSLGREYHYVNELFKFMKKGMVVGMMLCAKDYYSQAMIEARSFRTF
jgi:hypothetical protein